MKKYLLLSALVLLLGSCQNWLDIKPKTSINEEDLFSSESGFKDALTGFYIKMGKTSLYGKNLTFRFMDILAQRYDIDQISTNGDKMYNFKSSYRGETDAIYSDMYNLIANINNFLYQLEKRKDVVITKNYYDLMRGEALGLRAFLHFDLLRMFGPVYGIEPAKKSISYRVTFDKHATPLLAASAVVDLVVKDLLEAQELLAKVDSKIFSADEGNNERNPFLILRQLRMNVYAVKATLARVYLYKGDVSSKQEAFKYASEVVECGHFKFQSSIENNLILFNEHIFSLNVYELNKIIDPIFNNENVSSILYVKTRSLDEIYETSGVGGGDTRLGLFREIDPDKSVTKKYNQTNYVSEYDGKDLIPLIRLPEMYYILSECDPDPVSSAEWLNIVRNQRAIPDNIPVDNGYDKPFAAGIDKTQTFRVNELMKEYMKEFYGEGQLFYFYKRHCYKYFRHCGMELGMEKENYMFQIPDNEIIFGKN
ncbi:MAG: RagB/SusD family nutrient uptake outer membrane protein [Odoribacter sp.]